MRVSGPTLDAADPMALAAFYERLLGWPIVRQEGPRPGNPPTDGWAMLRSPAGDMKIEVQWEPQYRPPVWPGQQGKQLMMMHLDIGVADVASGVEWALAQGARVAEHQPQPDVRVLLDPEGHPFCLFPDDTL
ncbi:MAG: VOC family protein [Actinomycetota bacterium]|nr:VOC family protein [Actinomycetota bacterium]